MLKRDTLTVNSRLESLSQVQRWFKDFYSLATTQFPCLKDYFDRLNLALAEGFTNAVRHAHSDLPPETSIDIELLLQDDRLEIRIWDQGNPFNPDVLEEPEPGALLEGGYGWFLLRRLADKVTYQRFEDKRNCLWIVQYIHSDAPQSVSS